MYKSPIEIIYADVRNQFVKQIEEDVYKVVVNYFPNVDKDELIRALQYDRQQYEQGYRDAKAEIVHCEECWKWYPYNNGGSHDCPYCGYPDADFYCGEGDRKTE